MQPAPLSQRSARLPQGETALVDRARLGDEDAVRALIRRNNRQLFRVARAVLGNDGEAEDVVQETYVRAFTRLEGFRGEARFSTWLTRIALNEALGRKRRQRPSVGLEVLDSIEAAGDGPAPGFTGAQPSAPADFEAGREQMRRVLEQTIDTLPEHFRMVLILRDVEGLGIEETAGYLAVRPETVKTRLFRARRLMRAALAERVAASFSELFPFDGARCVRMAERVLARLRR